MDEIKMTENTIKLRNDENRMKCVMKDATYAAFQKYTQEVRENQANAPLATNHFLSIKLRESQIDSKVDDRSQYTLNWVWNINKDGREMEMTASMYIQIFANESNISLSYNSIIPYSKCCNVESNACVPVIWWTTDGYTEKPLYDKVYAVITECLELFVMIYDYKNIFYYIE